MHISHQAKMTPGNSPEDNDLEASEGWEDDHQEDGDSIARVQARGDSFSPSHSWAAQQTAWESRPETPSSGAHIAAERDWKLPMYSRVQLDRSFTGVYVNGRICHSYQEAQKALRPS